MTVVDPTTEQLEGLLELQGTDDRIRRVDHELSHLAEQQALAECAARLAAIGRELEDLELEREKVAAEQRQLEREVDILGQRRDAERARLYGGTVGSAREMQAVEAEIASTERRISEHEDLLLEVLERGEQHDARRAALEADRAATIERERELEVARDAAAAGLLAELGERKVERDRQAAALPAELLAQIGRAHV